MAQGDQVALPAKSKELVPAASLLGFVLLAGLEGNLQHAVAQAVAVETGDSHGGFVIVGHGDKAEALTFVGGEVADDLDVGDGAEGPEELPQDALVRLGGEVVDKDAPAGSGGSGEVDPGQAGHAVDGNGRESGEESGRATMGVILQFITASRALNCLMGVFLSHRNKDCRQVWSQETPPPPPSPLLYSHVWAPQWLQTTCSHTKCHCVRTLRHRHPHNVHIFSFSLLAEASGRIKKHESQCLMKKKERKGTTVSNKTQKPREG